MLRDIAVALLADRMNRTDLTTRIINEMQFAQTQLENDVFLPWFLLTDVVSKSTVALDERLALPTDYLREPDEDESNVWLTDSTTSPPTRNDLAKNTYGILVTKYKNSKYAQPLEYAVVNNYMRLRPIPDKIYTIQFLYYAADALLTTNIENGWLREAPDLLIAQTGMQITKYPRDDVRYKMFSDDYKTARTALMVVDTARREANVDRFMGDADA